MKKSEKKAAAKAPDETIETIQAELVVIEPANALAVFSADNGLDPYIEKIRAECAAFIADTSTKKGRDEIASMAYKVAKSKTFLDNAGKELVAELKAIPAKIDAERKRMRETLDALRDSVRAPLTDWETAEAARVADLQARVAGLENAKNTGWSSADEIRETLAWVTAVVVDESWQEYQAQGVVAKAAAIDAIGQALSAREKYDAEQAELARLRAEAAEREQRDREERIAREAAEAERQRAEREAQAERDRVEAQAKAEREAAAKREADAKAEAERRELELKLAAETAQRQAAEAQQRALEAQQQAQRQAEQAAQAERDRQAQEAARAPAELAAREKDREHKKAINSAALADFMAGGMTEDCAKLAITLIVQKAVRNVTMNY
jgi:hypothetical protein